ncbi:alcohol dehydrogenase YqhD (iron-dependent ADH family) [Catenibacillus scindens]|uniref:Alcohol dehydrogenase YqhD (Iron-dependent ADH family) n=1 Tax=Catenibacillus scindens TaxID=673271 RepID=A0A7W8H9R5_9FIRM|nr:hypothetical protein [Catenibacillus scindens]MBB5264048.1 alcohol dehydrogenase YqhD (iron-dependent ADH family) [Catenibacillus scindens]
MNKFTFSYPTRVYFGEGSAAQAFSAELGNVGETVMLTYGGGDLFRIETVQECFFSGSFTTF